MKNKAYGPKFKGPEGAITALRIFAVVNLLFGVILGMFFLGESTSWEARNSYFGTIGIIFILEGVLGWAILTLICSIAEKFFEFSQDISTYVKTKSSIEFGKNIDEIKKCPMCAEFIKLEALKCKFCGQLFDSKEVANEVEKRKEELRREQEGLIQCPKCKNWDVKKAFIEDGSVGDWCPHCEMSLQIESGKS